MGIETTTIIQYYPTLLSNIIIQHYYPILSNKVVLQSATNIPHILILLHVLLEMMPGGLNGTGPAVKPGDCRKGPI